MPSTRPVLLFAFAMALAAGLALAPEAILDPDLWWHLRTGEWILETGSIPRTDAFSAHGTRAPWLAYTWAFDLVLVAIWSIGRETAICCLVAAICALVAAWVVRAGLRNGHSATFIGLVVLLVSAALTGYATPRPWWASVAGMISVFEIVRGHENGRDARMSLLLFVLVFGAWANLHIQFVYGLAVLALWQVTMLLSGKSVRIPAFGMAAAVAATLVNPYGARLYLQGLDYAKHSVLAPWVEELRPPDFSEPYMVLTAVAGCLAVVVLFARRPPRSLWFAGLLLLGTILFLRSRRDGWLLVIASAWTLVESPPVRWQAGTALRVVALSLSVSLFVSGIWRVRPHALRRAVARAFPVDAVPHLPPAGSVFTPFDWGGYVLWAHPGTKVTIDGRTNVHGVERTIRHFAVWTGQRPWESEEELRTAAAVIAPRTSRLSAQLRAAPEWRVLYEDDLAVVVAPPAAR